MPLRAHLRELRRRLVRVTLGLVVGASAGWFLYSKVFGLLIRPLEDVAKNRSDIVAINFSGLAGSLDMQVQVSMFLGVLLTSPWWMFQLWAFITPGLTSAERRYAIGFLGAAVPLFSSGAAVAWWALPHAVDMLTSLTPTGAQNLLDASSYVSFVTRLVLAFGLAFLLPVLMVGLHMVGVVDSRFWLQSWRWAVVLIATFAAVATPTPDALSMVLVATPMCALYFGAIGVCVLLDRRAGRRRRGASQRLAAGDDEPLKADVASQP